MLPSSFTDAKILFSNGLTKCFVFFLRLNRLKISVLFFEIKRQCSPPPMFPAEKSIRYGLFFSIKGCIFASRNIWGELKFFVFDTLKNNEILLILSAFLMNNADYTA